MVGFFFTIGNDILTSLILTVFYEKLFIKMHIEQKNSRQKTLIEKKISNINNEIKNNNSNCKGSFLTFNEEFYNRFTQMINNILDVIVYVCLNVPIILWNTFISESQEKPTKFLHYFIYYSDKVVFCVICMFFSVLVCISIISNLPEYRRTNAICEKRNKEIKNDNYFNDINNFQSYKSLNDYEKLFIKDYDEKEFEILNN